METLKVSSLGFPWKEFLEFFSVVQSFKEQTLKLKLLSPVGSHDLCLHNYC